MDFTLISFPNQGNCESTVVPARHDRFSALALSHVVAQERTQVAKDPEDAASLQAVNLLRAHEQRQHAEYQRLINRTRHIADQAIARARRLQHRRQVQIAHEQRSKREALRWKMRL